MVEAAPKSGSLITARLAGEAGREVMAIPGSPLDARSHGCNQLIREGAVLVQAPEDVIELLRGFDGTPRSTLREAQPHAFGGDDELLADEPADIAALLTTAPVGGRRAGPPERRERRRGADGAARAGDRRAAGAACGGPGEFGRLAR